MAQVGEGPVLHENSNQNPNPNPDQNPNQDLNQVPNPNPPPNENPQNPPPPLNPFMSNAPVAPAVPQNLKELNWSHFKPEFTGKPNGDVEAHLLRTNNWMDTHGFSDKVKVQRFCLTLVGRS